MSMDTFIAIVCFAGTALGWVAYRFLSENVYIKGKYQRGRYIHGGTRHDY